VSLEAMGSIMDLCYQFIRLIMHRGNMRLLGRLNDPDCGLFRRGKGLVLPKGVPTLHFEELAIKGECRFDGSSIGFLF
jgi:hypothetical protein